MRSYVSFGKYNKSYKHIWYYAITKLAYDYFLDSFFVEKVELLKYIFPKSFLIQEGFNYLGVFICSIFLLKYEKISGQIKSSLMENKNLFASFLIVIIFLFITIQSFKFISFFRLGALNYWMFEILFIAILSSKLLGVPIYKHRKFGIIIISVLSFIFKILSTIYSLYDDDEQKIYIKYYWIVFIGITFSILMTLLRSYTFCKMKILFDKLILPSEILILSSFLGIFVNFIVSIIPSNYPCTNDYNNLKDDSFKDDFIKFICQVRESNSTVLYFESYSIYFKELLKNNILLIILFIFKIGIYFCNKLFFIYIIKNLSAEFIVCANSITFSLVELFDLLYIFFTKTEFNLYKFFSAITQLSCLLGSIIYLELIKFHFCELDHDLNKNIQDRAVSESIIVIDDIDVDDDDDDSEVLRENPVNFIN